VTRKVLILGGGMAGLTAAYELTRTPELRAAWSVEVVEMGHRYGGRLASAHRPERWHRNEEHGLHVWFGFYDNTFRLAEDVYRAWQRPDGFPFDTVWDALRPIHHSDHGFDSPHGPRLVRSHHPSNADQPGLRGTRTPLGWLTTLVDALATAPRTLSAMLLEPEKGAARSQSHRSSVFPAPGTRERLRRTVRRLESIFGRIATLTPSLDATQRVQQGAVMGRAFARMHAPVVRLLRRLTASNPHQAEFVAAVDLLFASTRAVLDPEHGVLHDGDLDRLSHLELRELLGRHGAHADTLSCSRLLDSVYDMPFAYVDGRRDKPVLEAGTALRFTLRIVADYKYAIAFLLKCGAGETLVAPLVELLRSRGVTFTPFHRLSALDIDTHHRRVRGVRMVRAARVKDGYPLTIRRGPFAAFAAEPSFEHLEDGDQLRDRGVDFYSRFGDRGEDGVVERLEGRDFDDVILALPLGSVVADADGNSPVGDWLDFHEPARRCLERLYLVPTVAAQVWLRETPKALTVADRSVVTFRAPYSVFCDMTPVIDYEGWGEQRPAASVYLCGAHPLATPGAGSHAPEALREDFAEARAQLVELLDSPEGSTELGGLENLFHGRGVEHTMDTQYVRANVQPWDLADLARPGADAVRLEAADTGLTNMALAGAWVRTIMNTTSLEGAVSSGIAAARALGVETQPILAEDFLRRPSRQPYLPGRERHAPPPVEPAAKRRSWRPRATQEEVGP
jgi:uncharacterized protein with NAD-binding domain and iron-sulfur cluster